MKKLSKLAVLALFAAFVAFAFFGCKQPTTPETPVSPVTPDAKYYSITLCSLGGGNVTANKVLGIAAGEKIKLTITAEDPIVLQTLVIQSEHNPDIPNTKDYEFFMPAEDVTVIATFETKITPTYSFHNTVENVTSNQYIFGDYPFSEKDDKVIVNEGQTLTHGEFTYCLGNDGNWYYQVDSKFYKVEPISWYEISTDYNGNKLLLSEFIITAKRYSPKSTDGSYKYEYSEIRNWLNSGFLNTAFEESARALIKRTSVVNNAASTNPKSDPIHWNHGQNGNAGDPTTDQIFLLSEQEVTDSNYGFTDYNVYGSGNDRIKVPTDFAVAVGAYKKSGDFAGNGRWMLRSPTPSAGGVHVVVYDGDPTTIRFVTDKDVGIVPALCVAN